VYYGTYEFSDPSLQSFQAGTHVGDYAVFFGGYGNLGAEYNRVLAIDSNLIESTPPTPLSNNFYVCTAASAGNKYAIAAGGMHYSSGSYHYNAVVNAYNEELVRSLPAPLPAGTDRMAAADLGEDYAIFGGGATGSGSGNYTDKVYAYDTELIRSIPTALRYTTAEIVAASLAKTYTLFGYMPGLSNTTYIDAYSTSLVRITVNNTLSSNYVSSFESAVNVKNKAAIFANYANSHTWIAMFTENLVGTKVSNAHRGYLYGVIGLGGYAVYRNSDQDAESNPTSFRYIDENFVIKEIQRPGDISPSAAAAAGEYAIWTAQNQFVVFKLV
jgi:hypothetical protein